MLHWNQRACRCFLIPLIVDVTVYLEIQVEAIESKKKIPTCMCSLESLFSSYLTILDIYGHLCSRYHTRRPLFMAQNWNYAMNIFIQWIADSNHSSTSFVLITAISHDILKLPDWWLYILYDVFHLQALHFSPFSFISLASFHEYIPLLIPSFSLFATKSWFIVCFL